jgi:hypothetical protein
MRFANDVMYRPRAQLGETTFDQNKGIIQFAASQIPVVGPFISAGLGVIDSIFGWGDPNSIDDLFAQMIQGRLALAVMHHNMGIADPFNIPAGFDNSEAERADLGMLITDEYLHKGGDSADADLLAGNWDNIGAIAGDPNGIIWHAYPSSERRTDSYKVVGMIKNDLQNLQLQASEATLAAPLPGAAPPAIAPPIAAPPATSPDQQTALDPSPDAQGAPPATFGQEMQNYGPWALLGLGGLTVLVLAAKSGGGSRR